ncbi:hypothetical protein Agabi119p4_8254 [Agaricus bisporus var. burnettii]|uniref:Uncharacterized protein n=1 Tax=Agaricus bisporus var. burnettii TaxID=192524 RepID=A0A8H7C6Q2_AGABI|nr:hypothetical protein Agabi119p4_8254 [Agaricus bisporus var. burnettii]
MPPERPFFLLKESIKSRNSIRRSIRTPCICMASCWWCFTIYKPTGARHFDLSPDYFPLPARPSSPASSLLHILVRTIALGLRS